MSKFFSKATIDSFRSTLKGHGRVVSSQMAVAESAVSEEVAKRAEATASAAYNKAIKLRRAGGKYGEALSMWTDVLPDMSRHDPDKAAFVQETLETGKFKGLLCRELLPFAAFAIDGRINRDPSTMYCDNGRDRGRIVKNNHATFYTLLEKRGYLYKIGTDGQRRPVDQKGGEFIAYQIIEGTFWNAIRDIASS